MDYAIELINFELQSTTTLIPKKKTLQRLISYSIMSVLNQLRSYMSCSNDWLRSLIDQAMYISFLNDQDHSWSIPQAP